MPNPSRLKCLLACGARPNFMKIASLVSAFDATGHIDRLLVHTGQHYDANMSRAFFVDLGLPEPDVNLGCGEGSHGRQTADIMQRFEPLVVQHRPDWLIVVGDVNSTIACALVAAKLNVPIAHVEAGLRSFDRSMPEEINRVLTDRLSQLLFVTEPAGMTNLAAEGIDAAQCHLVGDTMADTLLRYLPRARQTPMLANLGLTPGGYALLTLHRAGNVDDPNILAGILDGLSDVTARIPVLFPVHPRTRGRIAEFGLSDRVARMSGLRLIDPLGYLDFLGLMASAKLVITDSGGIQEETTILGVPCATLRESTERPYTVETGTNTLVPPTSEAMRAALPQILSAPPRIATKSPLTDGQAGERIAAILLAQT
ncbi:MAG TPA: UDP-N-acetylglucosamine 2-epimerase (non-hydrolyzing) [Phycisphaerae bacterium]|nr:UDP-N-acetylglucosamine 2-epimerase (non-hydrolyzing) [Phycisphaerae bacterium]